jgi:hypothetical protein
VVTVSNLNEVMPQMAEIASKMHGLSALISSAIKNPATRTQEQSGALASTHARTEELATTVARNAEHASQADVLAGAAGARARDGREGVAKVVDARASIETHAGGIAGSVATIGEISFQTCVLALNATVEAACAGAQARPRGRGRRGPRTGPAHRPGNDRRSTPARGVACSARKRPGAGQGGGHRSRRCRGIGYCASAGSARRCKELTRLRPITWKGRIFAIIATLTSRRAGRPTP